MRPPSTIYQMLVAVIVTGVMIHMFLLVVDMWTTTPDFPVLNTSCSSALMKSQRFAADDRKALGTGQWSWKDHIKRSCESLGIDGNINSLTRDMLYRSKILVDDKYRFLYCQIAKVASTTWRRIFIMMSGKSNITNLMTITANDAHHKYDGHLTYLSDLPKEEILFRLKNYFKFVFVREPFGRLLSAFRNKFVVKTNASSYFQNSFGRKIIKRYRIRPPAVTNGSDVNFQEFVNYLVDAKRKIQLNEHWHTFNNLCHPCIISYDFIGKLETFSEDAQYILTKNSLPKRIKIPSRSESRYSNSDTTSFLAEYYSKLSATSLRLLYDKYIADFVIFNYSIPDVIKYLM